MRISIASGLISSIVFACCGSTPDKSQEHFVLKLIPDSGNHYQYNINNETKTYMNVNGQDIESSNTVAIGVTYHFGKDSLNNTKMTIRYNKLILTSNDKNGEKELDV